MGEKEIEDEEGDEWQELYDGLDGEEPAKDTDARPGLVLFATSGWDKLGNRCGFFEGLEFLTAEVDGDEKVVRFYTVV